MKVFDSLIRMGYKRPILLAGECSEEELAAAGSLGGGGRRKPRTNREKIASELFRFPKFCSMRILIRFRRITKRWHTWRVNETINGLS